MGQEVVLEDEVQQQVELIKVSPQEGEAGRVGLCQDLRRITVDTVGTCLSFLFFNTFNRNRGEAETSSYSQPPCIRPSTRLLYTSR